MNNKKLLGLLILSSIITTISLLCIKQYIITKNITYIVLSAILYMALIYIYVELFQNGEISSLYVILQIVQILIVSLIGIVLYHEKITTNKIIGIIAGLICVYLIL